MATFVAKNSGAVKKKSVIILKEFIFFVLVSTSSASDWQGCEDSHWIKRTTFVFHKIAIYNNCKLFLNLKAIWRFIKNITYSRCSKAFSVMAWNWGQNRSLHFISCVFLCEATKGASDWQNNRLTRKSNNTQKKLVPVCPIW